MYNGGVIHPYTSPAPMGPDSMKNVVSTPEDALRLAKFLVQQGCMGGDLKPKTAEEAKRHAVRLLNEYLGGNWNSPAQRPVQQAVVPSPNRYEKPRVAANNIPPPQAKLPPSPFTKNTWTPNNAKDLEDYITDSVEYYKKNMQPPTVPKAKQPPRTLEDTLVDRLTIAYVDSVYAESRRSSLALPAPTPIPVKEPDTVSALQNMNVAAHNTIRSKLCKPPLKLSMSLVHKASAHAAVCSDEGHAYPSPDITEGQNVHYLSGAKVASMTDSEIVQNAIDAWQKESLYYTQVGGGLNGVRYSKSFSQLVWAATTSVGVGVSRCKDGAYVVCCYYPKANPVDDRTIRANIG
eukprot:TRINITY_DN11143_c3_g1_i1.p1 TRINITY_DN11143_c3_g1~~TRINITY_DN11143_c3_g1_i1.p1  ORF type:complete len:358 (+),score=84.38 TRINITY_DN11143_c3_g1_i1:31-1074(+)